MYLYNIFTNICAILTYILFLFRKFSIDNCLLSNVNLGFYDNLDDVLADSQWDLYRQSNDFQCSSDSGGSGGMYYV